MYSAICAFTISICCGGFNCVFCVFCVLFTICCIYCIFLLFEFLFEHFRCDDCDGVRIMKEKSRLPDSNRGSLGHGWLCVILMQICNVNTAHLQPSVLAAELRQDELLGKHFVYKSWGGVVILVYFCRVAFAFRICLGVHFVCYLCFTVVLFLLRQNLYKWGQNITASAQFIVFSLEGLVFLRRMLSKADFDWYCKNNALMV